MISFAGGYPASDLFDVDGLNAAAARTYAQPTSCLQYGPTGGLAGPAGRLDDRAR